ncbi:MAG: hypothetical protein ABIJ96_14800 [Elusimicrobiota bacterium]
MTKPKHLIFIIALMSAAFIAGRAAAAKPTVPLAHMIHNAAFIATGEITHNRQIAEPRRGENGEWLQSRSQVRAKIGKIIKFQFPEEIEFEVGPLTLEKGKEFVLFLNLKESQLGPRRAYVLDWQDTNTKRIIAEKDVVEKIKELIP